MEGEGRDSDRANDRGSDSDKSAILSETAQTLIHWPAGRPHVRPSRSTNGSRATRNTLLPMVSCKPDSWTGKETQRSSRATDKNPPPFIPFVSPRKIDISRNQQSTEPTASEKRMSWNGGFFAQPQRGSSRGRPGRGNYRGGTRGGSSRGGQWRDNRNSRGNFQASWRDRPDTGAAQLPALPCGPLIESLRAADLDGEAASFEDAAFIRDVEAVTSFSWMDGKTPTILVPGKQAVLSTVLLLCSSALPQAAD